MLQVARRHEHHRGSDGRREGLPNSSYEDPTRESTHLPVPQHDAGHPRYRWTGEGGDDPLATGFHQNSPKTTHTRSSQHRRHQPATGVAAHPPPSNGAPVSGGGAGRRRRDGEEALPPSRPRREGGDTRCRGSPTGLRAEPAQHPARPTGGRHPTRHHPPNPALDRIHLRLGEADRPSGGHTVARRRVLTSSEVAC